MRRFAAETKKNFAGITAQTEARLVAYAWPGNVRELANVIKRAAVLAQGSEFTLEDLALRVAYAKEQGASDSLSYRAAIDAARATVIRRALAHTHGNRAAAARTLGLHKTHLLNLMKTLGIE